MFGFLLLPQFTLLAFSAALDPLRIANQLAQKPLYGWLIYFENGDAVSSSSGIEVGVQAGLEDLKPDAYLFVCPGNNGNNAASDTVLGQVRRHARFGGKAGGVCTGAATLARAELLLGKKFMLHWENQPGFCEAFPALHPTQQRLERDVDLLTSGGGGAAGQ